MSATSQDEQARDLVLAAAQGYDWEDLRPFVESLRATGYSGEVRFFVSGIGRTTTDELRMAGISMSQPRRVRARVGGRIFQPYGYSRVLWHLQPSYRRVVRTLAGFTGDPEAASNRISAALANVDVARYFWYLDYLSRPSAHYRNVMLTDVRDVVFTRAPFDRKLEDSVYFFLEDPRLTLNKSRLNVGWLVEMYGPRAVVELGDRPISCSGVILGDVRAVRAYLSVMVNQLRRLPRQDSGIDQGVHNYVVHKGLVPNSQIVANGDGSVLTVGLMSADEASRVLRERGSSIRIVHQYDRHPSLAAEIRALAGTPVT